jgi:hypothetical protein
VRDIDFWLFVLALDALVAVYSGEFVEYMLQGFHASSVSSIHRIELYLRSLQPHSATASSASQVNQMPHGYINVATGDRHGSKSLSRRSREGATKRCFMFDKKAKDRPGSQGEGFDKLAPLASQLARTRAVDMKPTEMPSVVFSLTSWPVSEGYAARIRQPKRAAGIIIAALFYDQSVKYSARRFAYTISRCFFRCQEVFQSPRHPHSRYRTVRNIRQKPWHRRACHTTRETSAASPSSIRTATSSTSTPKPPNPALSQYQA